MKPATNSAPLLLEIAYKAESLDYFRIITERLPMALLLQSDSSTGDQQDRSMRGRYDIITAAPNYWLESNAGQPPVWHGSPPAIATTHIDGSLQNLQKLLSVVQDSSGMDYSECLEQELPFCGGLIGYCSYDLVREQISLQKKRDKDIEVPDMQFGFYSWACIQDHMRKKSWIVIHAECKESVKKSVIECINLDEKITKKNNLKENLISDFFSKNTSINHYIKSFNKIKNYINSGDCYQINFSQRFTAKTNAKPIDIYRELRQSMPSPFSAILPVLGSSESAIISFSPERFVSINKHRKVITQPIKGTAPRYTDPQLDKESSQSLVMDKKNRAENVMIVDLLRNDLGRVCKTGSIFTSSLCELQSFSNVHHLVSTIEGTLSENYNGADLLMACFPGGSITGAPKRRAIEIIDEIEVNNRSIYCGNIVFFSSHGIMDSSILIRTLLVDNGKIHCWGGGGIVSDSECEMEYLESITKIKRIIDTLENSYAK